MPDERRVKTQNPRGYTVQIRVAETDEIVGTGVAVDAHRVVTSAHVVEDAGVAPRAGGDGRVDIYYPQAAGSRDDKTRGARVEACFEAYDDDVVLLALEESAPIGPERYADLGYAEPSAGHRFRAYGYKRLGKYQAGHAYGIVMGCVESPPNLMLQVDPVELNSPHLDSGMSGAGVLDMKRNLVVGLVSEVNYAPDDKNRDVGWAVDAKVLIFDPLNLQLVEFRRPKERVASPPELPDPRHGLLRPKEPVALHGAPAVLEEWVGREELLAALTWDWRDTETTITVLAGFGGEGKSSVARKWLSQLPRQTAPDAVFWWSFYGEPDVETFFEALLDYLGGGCIDPRDVPSTSGRMELAARMLRGGRYLLVLDGFEVMQHQQGDDYGFVKSSDLRCFLEYLAAPEGETFTLITSRAPLLDLLPYTTATQRDVTRLNPTAGRALLRALGVKGPDRALNGVVRAWDGHALTLSLLGSLLVERYDGDVRHLDDLPPPTENEDRYERVHRVLRRYDEHLTEAERAFLERFSAFRTPVRQEAIKRVCTSADRRESEGASVSASYSLLPGVAALPSLLDRLIAYRLLKHDSRADTYTTHPLIRNHYLALFTQGDEGETQATHERIKEYYLELADDTPLTPSLDDLRPLIEVVHHACRAGEYDEAYRICRRRIYQGKRATLTYQLGAYETALRLMLEFFPDGDTSREPKVSEPRAKTWVMNATGVCLMVLGRLDEAVSVFRHKNALAVTEGLLGSAGIGYRNMAALYYFKGMLAEGSRAALKALAISRQTGNQRSRYASLGWQAWIAHLRGDLDAASTTFNQVQPLDPGANEDPHYIFGFLRTRLAEHLRQMGNVEGAQRVIKENLERCQQHRWLSGLSLSHRILGDLKAECGDHTAARSHYDHSLMIAHSVTFRPALIEALLARGWWTARYGDLLDLQGWSDLAFSDLREALSYVVDGGYRIYEASTRVALAHAHLAAGATDHACREAEQAHQMSKQMGYYWGQVEAEEMLSELGR